MADLTVKLVEELEINGDPVNGSHEVVYTDIDNFDRKIITVDTNVVKLVHIGATYASGDFLDFAVKYIRITNLDESNSIRLFFKDVATTEASSGDQFVLTLDKQQTFFMNGDMKTYVAGGDNTGVGMTQAFDASASALSSVSLETLKAINAQSPDGYSPVEVVVASAVTL